MTPNTRTLKGQSYCSQRWANPVWPKGSKSRGFSTTGQWTPKLQRYEYGTGALTLSALFPLQTQNEENLQQRDIHIPVDQSSEENYSATDILFASTSIDITDASATLKFNHALHRININLKGSVPEDLVIEVKSIAGGQISLDNGTVTPDVSDGYVWIKPFQKSDSVYRRVLKK